MFDGLDYLLGFGLPRRLLLLVFIHGINGETEFQDFPFLIHRAMSDSLERSHVLRTRTHNAYKSHGDYQGAVSKDEDDGADVILFGHGIGGFIAADVALLIQHNNTQTRPILGLITFDSPFLGINPRVRAAKVQSLFQKKQASSDDLRDLSSTIGFEIASKDPNFKPADAPYDTLDPQKEDSLRSPKDDLVTGTKRKAEAMSDENTREGDCQAKSAHGSLSGPLKSASGVNNYSVLRQRYQKLKELEILKPEPDGVRFVNYYNCRIGRSKAEGTNKKIRGDHMVPGTVPPAPSSSDQSFKPQKTKPHTFVVLPSRRKDENHPNWVPITMEGSGKVTAHQSMFSPGPSFNHLKHAVISTVKQWI
ncbi:unnamed protein product [Penicillium olsonii]|uniref:AB hydrolase-1 domain-containing protein n=1 Tax=Penicillium olsonii TaxID=99116 RepID=A0A9W4HI84_PENOL|nr:unnamed protein product [Penicillium olsonii]CAG8152636.1 unnamed protein product [Penicillium olsonii]